MSKELSSFAQLWWTKQVEYLTWFYRDMQDKTSHQRHQAHFQWIIDEIVSYDESPQTSQKLIDFYAHILEAKSKTTQDSLRSKQQSLKSKQDQIKHQELLDNSEDPDEYLAQALAELP